MDSLSQMLQDKPLVLPSVLLRNYRKIGLTTDEFMLFMQFSLYGMDVDSIAKYMGLDKQEIKTLLTQLVDRQLVQMTYQPDELGKLDIFYSFQPVYERMAQLLKNQDKAIEPQVDRRDVFSLIESKFSRALSSVDMEFIEQWLVKDKFDIGIIELAVSEAVLANALNIKYIDRILHTWQKQGIQTVEQAKVQTQVYRQVRETGVPDVQVNDEDADVLMRNFLR